MRFTIKNDTDNVFIRKRFDVPDDFVEETMKGLEEDEQFEFALQFLENNLKKYVKGSIYWIPEYFKFELHKGKKYVECECNFEPCNCCGGSIEFYIDSDVLTK